VNIENDREFEERIARALAIDVPDLDMTELPDVDSENVSFIRPRARFTPPAWFAMAATVVVATALGVWMLSSSVEYDSLAEEVLAHIDHEPGAFRNADSPVSDKRLYDVVPANLATMDHSAGLITYAQSCEINGRPVPHLVIQGQRGPVTILLMPEEKVTEAIDVEGEHISGVILPVGDGSIAIVGQRDERLDNIKKKIMNSVTWAT
jgi:hypothetical protein